MSSPGLGRPFKKEKDFERNIGKIIEIHLYRAVSGQKQLTGQLIGYDKDTITIQDENGEEKTIDRADTALVREYIEF